jgi:hypothetical protein
MNQFVIKGKRGYICLKLLQAYGYPQHICQNGGYDSEGLIEIKSGNYFVEGNLWFSTGDVYKFYQKMKQCYLNHNGTAAFWNYELSLKVEVKFNPLGKIMIQGFYKEKEYQENELLFEMESDVITLSPTLEELRRFVVQYGDLKGCTIPDQNMVTA